MSKRADRPISWPVPSHLVNRTFRDSELLDAFEKYMQYDGRHSICSAALTHSWATRSAAAWEQRYSLPGEVHAEGNGT